MLNTHQYVAESAVVSIPHDVKGEAIYVYCILKDGKSIEKENLKLVRQDLIGYVRQEIGAIATPEVIQFTSDLPKTRSGKIMRRILRKIASGEHSSLGDTSTLVNPDIVESLIKNKELS